MAIRRRWCGGDNSVAVGREVELEFETNAEEAHIERRRNVCN